MEYSFRALLLVGACLLVNACGDSFAPVDYSGPVSEWRHVGGSQERQQYSPLNQVNGDNVASLEVAWVHNSGDFARGDDGSGLVTAFEASPLVVNDTLYYCTPYNRIFALDPETGEERWVFDPRIDSVGIQSHICRGVTYWEDEQAQAGASCSKRIYIATVDARFMAVDADTGASCSDFGQNGTVDLMVGMGEFRGTGSYPTSPALAINDLLVLGALVKDNQSDHMAGGVVRAFDARSGALRWAFDPVPPQMTAVTAEDVANGANFTPSTPNSWSMISGDPQRGIIYVPMGNPANDFYRGEDRSSALGYYGSSLVALDAGSGDVLWHFQAVHHDLWDYDIAAQPVPFVQQTADGAVPGVVIATKMGHVFLLNAETGEPLFPVEERPVPQTDVPGEWTSPTQPFPTLPRPLMPDLGEDDLLAIFGFVGKSECKAALEKVRYEGIFTPPSLKGSLQYPGFVGGTNWGGVSVDPQSNRAIISFHLFPFVQKLIPRVEGESYAYPQYGSPYAMESTLFGTSFGSPCVQPPWSFLTAIDLNTGEQLWKQPFGTLNNMVPLGNLFPWGGMALGGNLQTAGGLSFIGATMDAYFRAFDVESGEELWRADVPYAAHAMPMTYRLRPDSKQFVVIASGGKGLFESVGSKTGDALVAFSLPD